MSPIEFARYLISITFLVKSRAGFGLHRSLLSPITKYKYLCKSILENQYHRLLYSFNICDRFTFMGKIG